MSYKFRKLLKQNHIEETDQDLPIAIQRKIQKFHTLEKSAKPEDTDEIIDKRNAELDALDEEIMKTLPEFFEIEDEEEIARQQAERERQQADESKKRLAEKTKKAKEAEAEAKNASEKAEREAKEKAEQEELLKPGKTNYEALFKLHKQGKKTVTTSDLRKMGFNTGLTGPIGINGCSIKEFELYRESQFDDEFQLIKH